MSRIVESESLYVYALMDRRVAPPTPGVRRGSDRGQTGVRPGSDPLFWRIKIIEVAGMFAAVERFAEPPALSEQALREQHQIVVRLARVAKAIIPVRFGAFLERDELERIVRSREAVLQQALRDVRGKAQMTVRVFGPVRTSSSSPSTTSGTQYLRARAELNTPHLSKVARGIIAAVRTFVSAEVIDAGRGGVQVTIHHLIDRRLASQYRSAVESASDSARAVVTGPWPPFAFAPDLWTPAASLERLTP